MSQRQPTPADSFQAAARAFAARDWARAEALCLAVLAIEPQHVNARHMLGLVWSKQGRLGDAIAKLREAIALLPSNPLQWMNLGIVHLEAGQFGEAVEAERRAISLQENFPEAYYNLSVGYSGLGRTGDAIVALQRAIALRPSYADAQLALGNLLLTDGRFKDALAPFEAALGVRPDWPEAHMGIAAAWFDLGHPAKAIEHYRYVLRLNPQSDAAAYSMGVALMVLGRVAEAKAAFSRAAEGPEEKYCNAMSRLARETLAEVIVPDAAAIAEYRRQVSDALRVFADHSDGVCLSASHTHIAAPSMMLAYYGGNVRPIMEQFAQAVDPQIQRAPLRPRQGKPKLGIVVTDSHESVFAKCWGGIAERLSRERFDVKLVCSRGGGRFLKTALNLKIADDEYLLLPDAFEDAVRVLNEQAFDWLHYWEIGTDAINYYLPFFRPAPGQSTCWGWPVTSGNSQVSSYLSSEQLESPDGAAHYTEQLVLLKRLPAYYVRPAASEGQASRTRFGIPDSQHLYLCTQNLRKFHPDLDALLAGLLRADSHGLLAIIGDVQPPITNLLLNRFRRTIPDVLSRVRIIPRMERAEYLGLVAVADVMLDTLHYGAGANTVYDAAAVGTPLVTLPGEFHRTLWAAAVNRRLGVPQLIASTPEEHVAKAVQVATDADLRHELRKQILMAGGELFEDTAVVTEHEEYFSEAIAATRALM